MNRFIKKVLAKYVKWVEIIGYICVLLFIGGLIALSFIKAEEEYVMLKGELDLDHHIIKLDKRHYIVDFISEPDSVVTSNAPLIEVTDDKKLISEQLILQSLEEQVHEARKASSHRLANQLQAISRSIERKNYPRLKISTIRTSTGGTFIMLQDSSDLLESESGVGGVFDFEFGTIQVSDQPADSREWKKLKPEQTAEASIIMASLDKVHFDAVLKEVTKKECLFDIMDLTLEQKQHIAQAVVNTEGKLTVNLKVHIGWKSWMRLIWR